MLDAAGSGRPFLGICVGMQMLFSASEESPGVAGLGVIPGVVRWIPGDVKKPQMQWNVVDVRAAADPLFAGLGQQPWFYFVHSLHGVPDDGRTVTATCEYGSTLNAAFRIGVGRRRAVPSREVGVVGTRRCSATSWRTLPAIASAPSLPRDGSALPVDRPARRTGRPSAPGRLRARDGVRRRSRGRRRDRSATDGAEWVHVVDLDAARTGVPANRAAIAAIADAVAGRASVQAGGGVRSLDDAAALADAGVGAGRDGLGGCGRPEPGRRRSPGAFPSPSPSTTGAGCRRRGRVDVGVDAGSRLMAWLAFPAAERIRDHRHRARR